MIYITGDTHGEFSRVIDLCYGEETTLEDTLVILGDVGINYYLNKKDKIKKEMLSKLPITLFCVKGNHEKYAGELASYELINYRGAKAYVEKEYPNIIFAKDGEIYDFEISGEIRKALVIGGAYSVDKWYRLERRMMWFENEQPSEETKRYVESQIAKVNNEVDYIFSHTAPKRYEPTEWFLGGIDQSTVDTSTEIWLDYIYDIVEVQKWYCGHYHGEKVVDNLRFMFKSIMMLT